MTTERKPENQTSSYEHLVGATALTSEGEPLGTVKETHGSYLFVDAPGIGTTGCPPSTSLAPRVSASPSALARASSISTS